MGEGLWRLTVADHFSSAHQLRHYQGKCECLHGHNFAVQVQVQGRRLHPELGIVMDFKELKALLKTVLAELDHCNLNEMAEFSRINPSSENIARHIYQRLQTMLPGPEVIMHSVSVAEGPNSVAIYMED
ncbi:6-pyruvoyltetrahydropterin/6-carboxytetrahydropterin synthase [Desulfonatronum thiosulfatophilum]|uniref:6-carboxy-5,6,7,8-tetrahydropterin synthase n=1 Tax=Desulfonatronum thiosulfatophilum TaxID=617002 RepID=A0A1G6C9H5_9BACT|nr:6-carboxytetrahydropterin synthase QueD [Desulfonatronum thiosulfatophilum]SDB29461.1 6-pyruvoyltetrahydropterin/6-carboxytetrahydropterin synthase [Desulfonatronum thiosulfatophilum]